MVDTRLVRVIMSDAKGGEQSMELQEHRILPSAHREVGADFLDRRNAGNVKRYLLKRLERLGLQVTVRSAEDTAALPACTPIFEGKPASLSMAHRTEELLHRV